jgi:hypothetical protein
MNCRYCGGPNDSEGMCQKCKRRYNRLASNKAKLLRARNEYEESKYMTKILDDLETYRSLREAGFVVPPVVEAMLERYKYATRPKAYCLYCGQYVEALHPGRSMCPDCYKTYNYLNSLHYAPKRQLAVKTRAAYQELLDMTYDRFKAGLKIPGFAMTILKEDGRYDCSVETDKERYEANTSVTIKPR